MERMGDIPGRRGSAALCTIRGHQMQVGGRNLPTAQGEVFHVEAEEEDVSQYIEPVGKSTSAEPGVADHEAKAVNVDGGNVRKEHSSNVVTYRT